MLGQSPHKISIAPMIDWTYTHFRVLMRLLLPKALLYTEMQTPGAIKHKPERALAYNPIEHHVAMQLGGSDIRGLVQSAIAAEQAGFCEINLNLGCPSDKVQAGRFGVCLMREPDHVAECIRAMKSVVHVPVSAKTRIGIDNQDSYDFFRDFALRLVDAGCDKLIVHARKAWLHGLNPKQNRSIPPINYEYVYRIKQELGAYPVIINGNIVELADIKNHLSLVDGIMVGRLACDNPFSLHAVHQAIYPDEILLDRLTIFKKYRVYMQEQIAKNIPLSVLIKPIMNWAHGLPGSRTWKQTLMHIQGTKDLSLISDLEEYLYNHRVAISSDF